MGQRWKAATVHLKVGELARRTGISIRTLHHYEEIGLLRPRRTESGHRVYDAEDVIRLQWVMSLRQIGLALNEIADCLDSPELPFRTVMERQIERLHGQIRAMGKLRNRLHGSVRVSSSDDETSVNDLLRTMELMNVVENYYTPEQLEWLKQRWEQVGEARIREVEAEWPRPMADGRAEMDATTDPHDPKVQVLMERWKGFLAEFTGGNPGTERSLQSFYDGEDALPIGDAINRELFAYVGKAME